MPYPSQISLETLVEQAGVMIAEQGVDRLSLNELSAALGVKTPSLYRYVANRTELLRAVNEHTQKRLFVAIESALSVAGDAVTRLILIARAYRQFAHDNPVLYGLAFTNTIAELQPESDELLQAVFPFQALIAQISGEENSLTALRGFLALAHGFVMLELANQLRRGGNLEEVFEQVVRVYIAGWRK